MHLGEGFFRQLVQLVGHRLSKWEVLMGFLLHPENPSNMKPKPMGTARGKATPHAIDLFLAKLQATQILVS